ncbi:unnamed protein product, partial [marine sediment metagenome]
VTGGPDPDCQGKYAYAGEHANKPYYSRDDNEWFIWWDVECFCWTISEELGVKTPHVWTKPDPVIGHYCPWPPAVGSPVVAAH